MQTGPLSERIDSILEKPFTAELKKKKTRSRKKLLKTADAQDGGSLETWEASQVSCPIPSRSPDQWVH